VDRAPESEPAAGGLACAAARELISAGADDELDPDGAEVLAEHLAHCAACAVYEARVTALARAVRVRPVAVDAAFVERVIERSRPARLGRRGWLRPALAWCGLLIALQSIGPLVFGEIDGTPTHVARHVGASSVALATGLLFVAWRPHRAIGMLPLVAALFGAMVAGAAIDLLDGTRSPASELAHVAELVGMVLLWMIAGSPGLERVERALSALRRRPGAARSTT
jgi:predicted anti-sigma-YlaC factor YlaD